MTWNKLFQSRMKEWNDSKKMFIEARSKPSRGKHQTLQLHFWHLGLKLGPSGHEQLWTALPIQLHCLKFTFPLSWAGSAPMSADFSHQIWRIQHPGASAPVFSFTFRPLRDDLYGLPTKSRTLPHIEWLRQLSGTLAQTL